MTTLYAGEYLVVGIKSMDGWLNQLEPQLAPAEFAARRQRWLDEDAHMFAFRPTCLGTRGNGMLESIPHEKFE